MKDFFSRLSARHWLFAISVYIALYFERMFESYFDEKAKISLKSLEHFGFDISSNLGFFEVLKSANWSYWPSWGVLTVGVPYLICAVYFMDFKNEANAGWRRVYLSAQILVPLSYTLFVNFVVYSPFSSSSLVYSYLTIIGGMITDLGRAELVVLILIKFLIWIREGFAKSAN